MKKFLTAMLAALVFGAAASAAGSPPQAPPLEVPPQAPPIEERVSSLEKKVAELEAKLAGKAATDSCTCPEGKCECPNGPSCIDGQCPAPAVKDEPKPVWSGWKFDPVNNQWYGYMTLRAVQPVPRPQPQKTVVQPFGGTYEYGCVGQR